MDALIKFDQPAIVVAVNAGRAIDRSFNYRDKTTKEVRHVVRKCLQGTFVDSSGTPTICACLPARDWDLDIEPLSRKQVELHVSEFTMGDDGINILRFVGYRIVDKK